jgi:hypothetical protein
MALGRLALIWHRLWLGWVQATRRSKRRRRGRRMGRRRRRRRVVGAEPDTWVY